MTYKDRTSSSCDGIDCPEQQMGEEKLQRTIHLKKLINEHFTNSIFLTKAPIILNEFLT